MGLPQALMPLLPLFPMEEDLRLISMLPPLARNCCTLLMKFRPTLLPPPVHLSASRPFLLLLLRHLLLLRLRLSRPRRSQLLQRRPIRTITRKEFSPLPSKLRNKCSVIKKSTSFAPRSYLCTRTLLPISLAHRKLVSVMPC